MLSYPYHHSPLPLPYPTLPLSASSFNFCDPELYVDILLNSLPPALSLSAIFDILMRDLSLNEA
jgi:hypothetical protein